MIKEDAQKKSKKCIDSLPRDPWHHIISTGFVVFDITTCNLSATLLKCNSLPRTLLNRVGGPLRFLLFTVYSPDGTLMSRSCQRFNYTEARDGVAKNEIPFTNLNKVIIKRSVLTPKMAGEAA